MSSIVVIVVVVILPFMVISDSCDCIGVFYSGGCDGVNSLVMMLVICIALLLFMPIASIVSFQAITSVHKAQEITFKASFQYRCHSSY